MMVKYGGRPRCETNMFKIHCNLQKTYQEKNAREEKY